MGLSRALYRRRNLVILVLGAFALFLLFRRGEPATALQAPASKAEAGRLGLRVPDPARDGFIKDPTEYFVQLTLRDNRVVVFSKPGCPHCSAAKELLQKYNKERGLRYIVIEMTREQDLQGIKHALGSLYQRETFPSIFVDAQCIGGNAELQSLEGHGSLAQLLESKGIIAKKPVANKVLTDSSLSKEPVDVQVKGLVEQGLRADIQEKEKEKEEDKKEPSISSEAEVKVRKLIKRHRVMVFSKTYCPYSRHAKQLLSQYRDGRGLDYTVLEADLEPDPAAIKAALGAVSGHLTFPNIFVDGKSLGGSDDLASMHKSGELAQLLREKSLIV
ncbi:hypothetical protein J3B02_003118 [Coemansia erecta]|uniref:Glutaredoxin domain-containing protein n=1 Tax=Coemansia asiatica TaxID=1052880 RepID=A0A9W8CKY0_9FUNG|nr:hypothetical protein LPJ64_001078 [Coemansia asiatica]KAJ2853493.1 hypothetical protein J3B02_003118 [Coemansia erecta]KAJ2888848.1 hypothetical protein FB639_000348 [Coemansia asiatica]